MKKRLISIFLLCTLFLTAISFTSCSNANPEEGSVTRMTVDINPSVEFMIDDQNKIVSVTALNDDGSILIVGEAFVGKTPEEAIEMMVTLASDTGYLVQGNAEASENTVKISVSGDSKYAEQLKKDITEKANDTLKALDINGTVEKVEALKIDALRQMALSTSAYTEEEIRTMDEGQLYKVISAGRIETALLMTEEMRSAYYSAKEYKISFAEREETARIIKELGGLYSLTHTAYKTALDVYGTAITELDNFRYEMLVSAESEYQKSLTELREAKIELLKQKNFTASLNVNGEEYASATATLQLSEENYNKMLAAYEKIGTDLNAALEALITKLRQAESTLTELEDTLFDANIEAKLQENAAEIEASLNAAKDGFFAEFESAHAEDIAAIEQALLAKKQQLKSEMKAEK
ncbi:MAG: hypothetical protein IJW11_02910 [Clostridia bacterium]|nr:hypothetical protein [Clostridia bacterium]